MLEQIIATIRNFPHNIFFHIGKYEFQALLLQHKKDFPWKGRRSRNAFLEEQAEKESLENYRNYIYWFREWRLEQIHIRFSIGFIFQLIAASLLLPGSIALIAGATLPALVAIALSMISYMIYLLFWNRLQKIFRNMQFTVSLIEILIKQEYGVPK